jgi:mono/diheme cytochrome c family protein
MKSILKIGGLVILIEVVIASLGALVLIRHGVSARDEPLAVEAVAARSLRRLATPQAYRSMRNPVEATPTVLTESRAHFADHCALCHGNDGSGQTEIGKNLYPKAPDMRQDNTQSLSDGELFYIIHNGIRLTGMPAWGEGPPEEDQDSWKLVHFIRHLSKISPEELEEMKTLNPKSAHELKEEEEEQQFLQGEDNPSPSPPHHH